MIKKITVKTKGQNLIEITNRVDDVIRESGAEEGLCTIFIQHTSASLIVQENGDPAVQVDLQNWLESLMEQINPPFSHTLEGPDDMPSHIKAVLTATSISIPIIHGQLALGTWQGVYLWEHRLTAHNRFVVVHISE